MHLCQDPSILYLEDLALWTASKARVSEAAVQAYILFLCQNEREVVGAAFQQWLAQNGRTFESLMPTREAWLVQMNPD